MLGNQSHYLCSWSRRYGEDKERTHIGNENVFSCYQWYSKVKAFGRIGVVMSFQLSSSVSHMLSGHTEGLLPLPQEGSLGQGSTGCWWTARAQRSSKDKQELQLCSQLRTLSDLVLTENSQAEQRGRSSFGCSSACVREEFGISAGTVLRSSL